VVVGFEGVARIPSWLVQETYLETANAARWRRTAFCSWRGDNTPMNSHRVPANPEPDKPSAVTELRRIADALERFVRLYDDRAAVDMNAKYPFGRATDRWRRGA